MERQLEKHHHEALTPARLPCRPWPTRLPALGIVAAVLGVIKTMGVDQRAAGECWAR